MENTVNNVSNMQLLELAANRFAVFMLYVVNAHSGKQYIYSEPAATLEEAESILEGIH